MIGDKAKPLAGGDDRREVQQQITSGPPAPAQPALCRVSREADVICRRKQVLETKMTGRFGGPKRYPKVILWIIRNNTTQPKSGPNDWTRDMPWNPGSCQAPRRDSSPNPH